ncbi:nucleotidyltransferase family protein [Stutzerimonas stutzeri]|uniref:nucleotidyltransferase family protein n=1 Tax=Stutzerimonas stutzeri TaxID=316 RepID=UPI0015E2E806|nr:nucleotidyltransferase family protein [Stutzerimonas stutzeri]MBA1278828.1 nucleotidyltransferase family protein [Stutzerimonas stutzeri]
MIVLILAAGRGSRFTESGGLGHKLDAVIGGESMLTHVMRAVVSAGLESLVVRPASGTPGMGASIAMGVRATASAEGWLILPGDLPLVSADTIRAVAEAMRQSPIVVPCYQRQRGHPVGFQRCYYTELSSLQGNQGAAAIVREGLRLGSVHEVSVDDPGAVIDVDTKDELVAVKRLFEQRQQAECMTHGKH